MTALIYYVRKPWVFFYMPDMVVYACDECGKQEVAQKTPNYLSDTYDMFPPSGWINTATYPLPPMKVDAIKFFCGPQCLVSYYSPKVKVSLTPPPNPKEGDI